MTLPASHRTSPLSNNTNANPLASSACACTVITATPRTTPLSDLLARIDPLDQDATGRNVGIFVILVTPCYASTVLRTKGLLETAIDRIYPHKDAEHGLHGLVAVVDRLPEPSTPTTSASSKSSGSEGLAFIFTDNLADAPNLLQQEPTASPKPAGDIATSLQARRSITFTITSDNLTQPASQHARTLLDPLPLSYSVQVPLANTIFQNGLPSTLIHERYGRDVGSSTLKKLSSQSLDQQIIKLPFPSADERGSNLSLSAPLVPLTSARPVVACMGNIVRRLSSGSYQPPLKQEENTILASQELEASVQAYFKVRAMPPQTVSVWALVIPRKTYLANSTSIYDILEPHDLPARWKDDASTWITSPTHTPLSLLQRGARIHKVLSGGGGWGKKAGLLSLDPDSSYFATGESSRDDDSFWPGFDFEGEKQESALRNIVSPGDYVQFYLALPDSSEHGLVEQKGRVDSNVTHIKPDPNSHSAEFGTVPSTIDTIPGNPSEAGESDQAVRYYPNHFGALSEVGIALTINEYDGHDVSKMEQVNQTKMDVPFGRFRLLSHPKSESTNIPKAGQGEKSSKSPRERFEKEDAPETGKEGGQAKGE